MEHWISESELKDIAYANYWNDEEIEKRKSNHILDSEFAYFEETLLKGGLPYDLKKCIDYLKNYQNRRLEGIGMDLAAGYLWAAHYLFKLGNIDQLLCVEYSQHRLFQVGPKLLEYYQIPIDKITLIFGSFYNLHVEDNSLDFVLLSQALHHADNPLALLKEVYRVLKPNGILIIIGEHKINFFTAHVKHYIKYIITKFITTNNQKLFFNKTFNITSRVPKFGELIPPRSCARRSLLSYKGILLAFFTNWFQNNKKIGELHSKSISFVLLK